MFPEDIRALGPTQLPILMSTGDHPASYIMGTVSFPEVKLAGRGINH